MSAGKRCGGKRFWRLPEKGAWEDRPDPDCAGGQDREWAGAYCREVAASGKSAPVCFCGLFPEKPDACMGFFSAFRRFPDCADGGCFRKREACVRPETRWSGPAEKGVLPGVAACFACCIAGSFLFPGFWGRFLFFPEQDFPEKIKRKELEEDHWKGIAVTRPDV